MASKKIKFLKVQFRQNNNTVRKSGLGHLDWTDQDLVVYQGENDQDVPLISLKWSEITAYHLEYKPFSVCKLTLEPGRRKGFAYLSFCFPITQVAAVESSLASSLSLDASGNTKGVASRINALWMIESKVFERFYSRSARQLLELFKLASQPLLICSIFYELANKLNLPLMLPFTWMYATLSKIALSAYASHPWLVTGLGAIGLLVSWPLLMFYWVFIVIGVALYKHTFLVYLLAEAFSKAVMAYKIGTKYLAILFKVLNVLPMNKRSAASASSASSATSRLYTAASMPTGGLSVTNSTAVQ